ncbi:Dyp-type peroxidase [Sphaerisporangium album]|uniref:Dyp-type peroxidase n=1 Tax=Sphaerisporangium album TaxID=509200 RepID=A0A367FG32_9ACTN|nr:Dyp-type peroxidase [Sphaerisporangium album]RCG28560.1 Dyp-type peroxidase [Sphaerisporangium album]
MGHLYSRRAFMGGTLAAGLAGAAAGKPATQSSPIAGDVVPFHGAHQSGVTAPPRAPQQQGVFVAYDVTAGSRRELTELFRTLTARARFLTGGGPAHPAPHSSGSGLLGSTLVPDGLTMTVAVGSSLFDGRFGLAGHKPVELVPMRAFAHDDLNPAECHGDLLVQLCANHSDALVNALIDLHAHAGDLMRQRWRIDGFRSPQRPSGTPRDLLGFHDDVANHFLTDVRGRIDRFVWTHPPSPEPAWTTGGTYQVVRIVRFDLDEWDRVPVSRQQKIIGRHKVTGVPLNGGTDENSPVVYDREGEVMPFNCHVRLANPQTTDSRFAAPNPYVPAKVPPVHIWRRSYQYMRAPDVNGRMDAGHAFCCFQRRLRTYVDMQRRLEHEMLVPFITPTGGGYFFVLPGVTDDRDHYARTLLT